MGVKIELQGMPNLLKALDKEAAIKATEKAVKDSTADLHAAMTRNAGEKTFNKGYFTGNLKRSIDIKVSPMEGRVGPTAEYAPYLEYGTRFMDAEPFAKPSLDEVRPVFERRLKEALKA